MKPLGKQQILYRGLPPFGFSGNEAKVGDILGLFPQYFSPKVPTVFARGTLIELHVHPDVIGAVLKNRQFKPI